MKDILNRIYNKKTTDFYELLSENLKKCKKMNIITVNPEIIIQSKSDDTIKSILLNKEYVLVADGVSIVKACKNKVERITGIDISTKLLEKANENKCSLYLYGSEEKVLNTLVSKIKKEYANINIIGYKNGYTKDDNKIAKELLTLKPDICLVALGVPKQEKFIDKYYHKLKKGIIIGVGGSFDVLSGYKKRAPKVFIKLNLEWLYRILKEPKRISRFIKYNIRFLIEMTFKK